MGDGSSAAVQIVCLGLAEEQEPVKYYVQNLLFFVYSLFQSFKILIHLTTAFI